MGKGTEANRLHSKASKRKPGDGSRRDAFYGKKALRWGRGEERKKFHIVAGGNLGIIDQFRKQKKTLWRLPPRLAGTKTNEITNTL